MNPSDPRQRHRVTAWLLLAVMAALALAALAQPVLADGEPRPLPGAISGPSADSLLNAARETHGLGCEHFRNKPVNI